MKLLWTFLTLVLALPLGAVTAGVWEVYDPAGSPLVEGDPPLLILEGEGKRAMARIHLLAGKQKLYFYRETLGFLPEKIHAPTLPRFRAKRLGDEIIGPEDPLPMDLGSLSRYDSGAWRRSDWELYRWNLFPQVLMMEAGDYKTLDLYLKRMAFFVEKSGFRGRLIPNNELTDKFGWRGYDYGTQDMAAFYNLAADSGFALNKEEMDLLNLLINQGLLAMEEGRVVPRPGALIGYLRETPWSYKRILLPHEAAHGIYFIRPGYRDKVKKAWDTLAPVQKELWLRYLRINTSTNTPEHLRRGENAIPYDTAYEELMINEFQAYWIQQGRSVWPGFVDQMFRLVAMEDPDWEKINLGPREDSVNAQLAAGRLVEEAYLEESGLAAGLVKSLEVSPNP